MDQLVQRCLAPNCASTTDQPEISFFEFPTDDRELIRSWNKALGFRANCKHIPDPKVCERHFRPEEIDRNAVPVVFTRPDVVPTVGVITAAAADGKLGSKESLEGRNGGGSSSEPIYCRLCAKVERQPLKNSLEKLMRCSETAKLLGICLESSREYEMLPSGVCDACAHMMKFWLKFVRTCSGAQGKLVKIFTEGVVKKDDEEDKKPETVVITSIKREVEESSELPTDYLVVDLGKDDKCREENYIITEETEIEDDIEFTVEKLEDDVQVDMNVKEEPRDGDSDSDFDIPKDFDASSGSDSHSGTDEDDEYDPEEDSMVKLRKNMAMKYEAFEEGDVGVEEKPKKKRGRPRKNEPRLPKGPRKPREKRDKSTDEKPASLCKQVCQICGKILSSSATFNVHMMTHTQQKDIACPICDRRFYVKQQLKIHIESIHEKKDFVCSICGLKCRWRKSLRRHMLLHNEDPYKHKCTYCDKAFARPNQLRYHVMKHTGDRVYCDICGADYRFNYMLTQHKIRKHGIVVEGVQLYKQSSRKKKTDGGEQSTSGRKNRVVQQVQEQQPQIQIPIDPPIHPSIAPIIQQMALPPDHDHRTNHSDLSHVSDLGSPATTASFATIGSPEPPPHFQQQVHPQSHPALQQLQHQPPQQHHQQQQPSPMGGAFNGAALAMSMPSGLIGFPSISRQ